LKAGSEGSIPDGNAKPINPPSAALKRLLDDVGKSSFFLNTIAVGLDAVENGHPKPAKLDVKWEPADRKQAARMARHSAMEAFIVRAAEALSAYIRAISVLPRFGTTTGKWTQDTGAVERLSDIASAVTADATLTAGGALLIVWRNRIVHNGKFTLSDKYRMRLINSAEEIKTSYRNLDVDRLIQDARSGRPTLKDASSMIAMAINLAREMDGKMFNSLSREGVIASFSYYRLAGPLKKVMRETAPHRIRESIQRLINTEAPNLYPEFVRNFGTEREGVVAALDALDALDAIGGEAIDPVSAGK
jgi:hypothetical protein